MSKLMILNSWVILIMLSSCVSHDQIKIYPIPNSDFIDTVKNSTKPLLNKTSYFILTGNISNRSKLLKTLDSFSLQSFKDQDIKELNQYSMKFYQESSETNLPNIQKDPKRLDDTYAQEHDLLFIYTWTSKGSLLKYDNLKGEVLNPKAKIIVTDVKK